MCIPGDEESPLGIRLLRTDDVAFGLMGVGYASLLSSFHLLPNGAAVHRVKGHRKVSASSANVCQEQSARVHWTNGCKDSVCETGLRAQACKQKYCTGHIFNCGYEQCARDHISASGGTEIPSFKT